MFTLSLTARKDLFDIVIFFARKPSFFIDRRPFWKLEAEKEVMEIFRQVGDRHSDFVASTCAQSVTLWCRYVSRDQNRDHFGLKNGLEIGSRHSVLVPHC